mmetsp:Transcript_62917/g.192464  ORF Transcript_62917/g.192464 Transcript_62917/m.192464 type:complete len:345 (-) Transcript_62917:473-1507(-)
MGPAQTLVGRGGLLQWLGQLALGADAAELQLEVLPELVQTAVRGQLRLRWQDVGFRQQKGCRRRERDEPGSPAIIVVPLVRRAERARDRHHSRLVRAVARRAEVQGVLPRPDAQVRWHWVARRPHVGLVGPPVRGPGPRRRARAAGLRPRPHRPGGRALSGQEAGHDADGAPARGGAAEERFGHREEELRPRAPGAGGRRLLQVAGREHRAAARQRGRRGRRHGRGRGAREHPEAGGRELDGLGPRPRAVDQAVPPCRQPGGRRRVLLQKRADGRGAPPCVGRRYDVVDAGAGRVLAAPRRRLLVHGGQHHDERLRKVGFGLEPRHVDGDSGCLGDIRFLRPVP